MPDVEHPYYPIIYVRGYAGTQSEVEDTTSDPYNGFNLGSTKLRQLWTGDCKRHFFESPLIRLMKDCKYNDIYDDGVEQYEKGSVSPRSIFIFRYYDKTSTELGDGQRLSIVEAAKELSQLILNVRDLVCGDQHDDSFRVYLVAHSMGGLVCRCFLQNQNAGEFEARKLVDKVYTYATPHNGIDMHVIGNVPEFFSKNDANNFNRTEIKEYLALPSTKNDDDVSSLDGKFDPNRFFCLVGTNHRDYAVAYGWSRRFVGSMSDGLVRIVNATTWGPYMYADGKNIDIESPRAFVHRSHSGYYGIVNSEEGYQNLIRFLFGNIRVDGHLEIQGISLPPQIEMQRNSGKEIRASYHFETVVRVRGKQWDLHRRTMNEDSSIFRKYDELLKPEKIAINASPRNPKLFSVFLSENARVDSERASLGFSIDLGVIVPEYEVDGVLWLKDHYEGGYLFRDKINLEAFPPGTKDGNTYWSLYYGFDSKTPNQSPRMAKSINSTNRIQFEIDVVQDTQPGIVAKLIITGIPWN